MSPYFRAMTLARNTVAYWTAQFGNYALAFVTSVFTAVHLGPEHRGLLVAVILANTLIVNLTNLGVQVCGMYFAGKSPERLARIHTLLVVMVLGISVVDFLIIVGMGGMLREAMLERVPTLREFEWRYLIAAVAVLPFSLYYFAGQGLLSGLGRVRTLSRFLFYFGAVTNALNLVAVICFPLDRPRLVHALILIWAASQMAAAIGLFVMLRAAGSLWARLSRSVIVGELGEMLSYGIRAFFGNFASSLVNRMDHLFILSAFGAVGIGIYNLSAKLAELVFQPSAAFENAGYARVASAGRDEAARLVQDLFRANWLLNVIFVGGLAVVARPLVLIVYHEEYADAVAPLVILLPGTMFLGGARMISMYFSAQLGKPQIPSVIAWITAGVNIAALWWVVVWMKAGLAAAAWATTGSYGFMLLLSLAMFVRETGLKNPLDYFAPCQRDWARLQGIVKR